MSLDIHEEQKKLQPFGFLGKDFAVMQVVKGENGHDDKYPIDPRNGRLMKWKQDPCFTTLADTFTNLAGVRKANPDMRFEVGALLKDGLIMLDLDNIYNEIVNKDNPDGLLTKLHQLTKGTYCEVSQSNKGVHFFFTATKTRKEIRNDKYELYDSNRWATLTGNTLWATSEIKHLSEQEMKQLEQFLWGDPKPEKPKSANTEPSNAEFTDADIKKLLNKAINAKNGDKFSALYNNEAISDDVSADDMSFALMLAFWTQKNAKEMDAIFRQSKRMRPKWDEIHSVDGQTYGEMTIENAIANTDEVYHENKTNTKRSFKSMKELMEALKQASKDWCKAHPDEDGKPCSLAKMPANVKLNLIYQYEPLAIVVTNPDNTKETKIAPISYYDWDNNIWEEDTQTIEDMLLAVDENIMSTKTRQNYIDTLRRSPSFDIPIKQISKVKDIKHRFIAVGNGVFDRQEKKLLPYDPEKWFFKSKINTNYVENACREPIFGHWSLSSMIKKIATDPNTGEIITKKEKLLWSVLKAGIIGADWLRQAVLLIDDGSGNSGKSTFTDIIANVVGDANVAILRLFEFQDPTKLLDAVNASVIIGDDNDPEIPLTKFDNFNTAVSSDPMRVRDYYKRSYSTRLHCFIIQSANGLPPLKGAKTAVYNRLVAIKFNTNFNPKNPKDYNVKHDYIQRKEFKEWLLWYVLNKVELGIALPDTEESKKLLNQTHAESDTVYAFAEEMLDQIPSDTVPSSYMYALYYNFCRVNNTKAVSKRKFTLDLQKKEKFKQNWEHLSKSCYLDNPETFVDSTQEGTCAKLLSDLAGQVGNYNTQNYTIDVQKRYAGPGFRRIN